MKGVISPELKKILNNPELRKKFFKEYFGVTFINEPTERPIIKLSDYGIEPKSKKKRNFWDIFLGK